MLCRYERTIFKSDKGFCIFSYATEDESVPKEARNRSFYHDDKIHFTAVGYHLVATNAVEVELEGTWEAQSMACSYRFRCARKSFLQIRPAFLRT